MGGSGLGVVDSDSLVNMWRRALYTRRNLWGEGEREGPSSVQFPIPARIFALSLSSDGGERTPCKPLKAIVRSARSENFV